MGCRSSAPTMWNPQHMKALKSRVRGFQGHLTSVIGPNEAPPRLVTLCKLAHHNFLPLTDFYRLWRFEENDWFMLSAFFFFFFTSYGNLSPSSEVPNVHSRSSSPSQWCLLEVTHRWSDDTPDTSWGADSCQTRRAGGKSRCAHKKASSALRVIPLFWAVQVQKLKSRLALFKHHYRGVCPTSSELYQGCPSVCAEPRW